LQLCHNCLVTIPKEIGRLTALKDLRLYRNQVAAIPRELGRLTALERLSVSFIHCFCLRLSPLAAVAEQRADVGAG